jgi:hypothetical protein
VRLLRLSDAAIGANDRVFRHARMRALLVWLAALCGDAAMFIYAFAGKWWPGYIFGTFTLLFLLLTLRWGHRAISSLQLAGAGERSGIVRAVSFVPQLSTACR